MLSKVEELTAGDEMRIRIGKCKRSWQGEEEEKAAAEGLHLETKPWGRPKAAGTRDPVVNRQNLYKKLALEIEW